MRQDEIMCSIFLISPYSREVNLFYDLSDNLKGLDDMKSIVIPEWRNVKYGVNDKYSDDLPPSVSDYIKLMINRK